MEKAKKVAVVFGGSGLVGEALIHELIENQSYGKIVAVLRNTFNFSSAKLEQILFSDFRLLPHLKDELVATDYFCCIGTTIKTAGSQDAFHKVDFDIPATIARVAQDLSIPNLVLISSVGANAGSSNFYLQTKGLMEKKVREIYQGNLKIVRPSLLMGKRNEERSAEKISQIFMKWFGWIFIGPLQKFRGIYAGDVAKAMIKLSEYPSLKVFFESNELKKVVKSKA